jgi:hypothetical protein
MYHYQISRASQAVSDSITYTAEVPHIKIKCYNIHTTDWTIPIEKYTTSILTWNGKTMQYLNVDNLKSPDIRIVLFDYQTPIYCKFTLSWTHIKPQHIFTGADHLIVKLDYRFSYAIQSTLVINSPHSI